VLNLRFFRAFRGARGWVAKKTRVRMPGPEEPALGQRSISLPSPDQARAILHKLRGDQLYIVGTLVLATGMQLGELVVLRWSSIDMEAGTLRIDQSVEQIKAGLSFSGTKAWRGGREISIPESVLTALRTHLAARERDRSALGLGRIAADGLVVPRADGSLYLPSRVAADWINLLRRLDLPEVTLEHLRHLHIGHLITSGVDLVTISRRLGQPNPAAILNTYPHLFGNADERAKAAVEELMSLVAGEEGLSES
jgi:integrase